MSTQSERLAEKARLATEQHEKEQQALAAKLEAAKKAEADEASKSPADKALERAFIKGTLPEEDRRAPGTDPSVAAAAAGIPPERPTGSVDEPVEVAAPGESGSIADLSRQGLAQIAAARDALTFEGTPIPAPVAVAVDMVKTPPALVPLSEVAPSTVEAAVAFQRIPNDRISHVHERADGTKVDALGHIFEAPPKAKK